SEVDDVKVLARPEHVAEVVLAVDPAALRRQAAAQARLEARVQIAFAREQLLRQLGGTPLQLRRAKLPQDLSGQVALRLVDGSLVERAVRFGRERRIVGNDQRGVQLRGARAEQMRGDQRAPEHLPGGGWDLRFREIDHRSRRPRWRLKLAAGGQGPLEIAAQLLPEEIPARA